MGSLQLCNPVVVIINMQSVLIASCLAAAALADADAFYGYGNALVGPSGISAAWPTAVGYGHQSTVYGARHFYGKRSADAYYGYGYGLGLGVAAHPGAATSYVARSPQGLHGLVGHYYGKRSADADAYYGYGYGVGILNNNVYSGFHGNHYANGLPGRSFAAVTRGKRSAEAEAEADPYYGYGYGRAYGYGHGYGFGHHGGYYGHGYGHGYGYGYYG